MGRFMQQPFEKYQIDTRIDMRSYKEQRHRQRTRKETITKPS